LRIAIDGTTWGQSRGFGRYTRALTRALLRVAPERELALVIDRTAARRDDLPDMPRVVVPGGRPAADPAAATAGRTPAEIWRKARALSRFDTIVFPTHTEFVPVSPRARVGLVVHDAILDEDPDAWLSSRGAAIRWKAKTWLACRQARVIATSTRASERAIRECLPVGKRPIVVLGAGADPVFSAEESAEDARRVGVWVPAKGRYLLYVGAFGPHKRVPDLVDAFGVLAAMPDYADVRLVLVGGGTQGWDPDRPEVERAVEELGPLGSRVVLTGFLEDATLAALYRGAACVVVPASIEGFGLPALEAMASGTPVVASRIPALQEVCGEAAEYFEDPAALPSVLARLLRDPQARASLARQGPARAAGFGWDQAARRLLAALVREEPRP
jgi:glycosyltransferase involved in cell wall biosynthesis